jgi:phosphoglycerate dehydrogenase-like enzyme
MGGFQLTGKTIGILGLGNIGQDLVKLLAPLGCKIIFNDIEDRTAFSQEHCLKYVTLEEVFQKADFVTVHVPLTRLTQGLINYSLLSTMKKGSFL